MNAPPLCPLELELDLTFNSASKVIQQAYLDSPLTIRLTESEPWHQDLLNWLQTIRGDLALPCPEMVRKTTSLSMGLQFTNDSEITELNAAWRQKSERTDVLSFPVLDQDIVLPQDQCVELGDIVVSITAAQRQAKQMNHALDVELRWLVSHGLLHLLGWDHPNPKRLNEMLNCQQRLLTINGNVQHHA